MHDSTVDPLHSVKSDLKLDVDSLINDLLSLCVVSLLHSEACKEISLAVLNVDDSASLLYSSPEESDESVTVLATESEEHSPQSEKKGFDDILMN